jgi:hypothetical protein
LELFDVHGEQIHIEKLVAAQLSVTELCAIDDGKAGIPIKHLLNVKTADVVDALHSHNIGDLYTVIFVVHANIQNSIGTIGVYCEEPIVAQNLRRSEVHAVGPVTLTYVVLVQNGDEIGGR